MKKISLGEHFTFGKLLRFTLPTVIMMVFTSIYTVVDGFFVSNFAGKTPFAAVNLIMPVIMAVAALGFMIGSGGTALVSKVLGEGDREKADRYFSMLVMVMIGIGAIFTLVFEFIMEPVAILLQAEGDLLENAVLYGRILIAAIIPYMLQNVFQSFFVTAEKPALGLIVIVCAGVTNAGLDALFIAGLGLGIVGAAVATVIGQAVGGILPIFYFASKNSSLLRLRFVRPEIKPVLRACANGSSEMLTNLSASVINMLYNFRLMQFAGEDGVAAYGFIMYVSFVFAAIFFGYSVGVAPVIGYNYGAGNTDELKNLFKKSHVVIMVTGVVMFAAAEALSMPLSLLFVGYDQGLYELTLHGFRLFSFAFAIYGFNTFGSAFFTALNNGLISAVISFARTLVFQIAAVMILPIWMGIDGVWLSVVVSEGLCIAVTSAFVISNRKRYGYI